MSRVMPFWSFLFSPSLILEPQQTSDPQKNKLQAIFTFKSPEDPSECNIHFFHWKNTERKNTVKCMSYNSHVSVKYSFQLEPCNHMCQDDHALPLAGRKRNLDVSRDTAFSKTCTNVHAAGFCQNHKRTNPSFNALNISLLHLLDDSP